MLSFFYIFSLILLLYLYTKIRKELKQIVENNEKLKIENSFLRDYVLVDEVTGFGNCVRYIQKINEMIDEYKRYKHIFSFVMIRLNRCDFKNKSTKFIIDIIKNHTRKCDLIAKFNEETLLILLPHTQLRNSLIFANKLKTNVDHHIFNDDDQFNILISVDSIEDGDAERAIYRRLEDLLLEDLLVKQLDERVIIRVNNEKLAQETKPNKEKQDVNSRSKQ